MPAKARFLNTSFVFVAGPILHIILVFFILKHPLHKHTGYNFTTKLEKNKDKVDFLCLYWIVKFFKIWFF